MFYSTNQTSGVHFNSAFHFFYPFHDIDVHLQYISVEMAKMWQAAVVQEFQINPHDFFLNAFNLLNAPKPFTKNNTCTSCIVAVIQTQQKCMYTLTITIKLPPNPPTMKH